MAVCQVCGNDYDRPLAVTQGNRSGIYDSFECAIHEMAPRCMHCGCQILGHGVQVDSEIFCCAHCASSATGDTAVTDRS
ncbi:MAG: hypothetical protein L0K74_09695 [Acidipropionibacterium acidipropionici]|jgi:nitrite reductase/ring-hydroxylating ferredoxin subunit|nr:hypothetical protein [Acidipropionibacterium acidipropionici]